MSDATPTNEQSQPAEQPLEPAPTPAPAQAAEPSKQQTFDADYVAKIRAEAAKYRTEAKANAEAAKSQAAEDERLKAETAEAEARIRSLRDTAMGNVSTIATETAQAIVEKLTGEKVAAKDVAAALSNGAA